MTNVCFTCVQKRSLQGLCAADLPNIDFAVPIRLLISAAPLCDNANSVINSAEYNGCHSADKEPRRDHVFRRQAKITALLMSAEGTKCFHKQATAFVFPLWRGGWEGGGKAAAGSMRSPLRLSVIGRRAAEAATW